MYVYARVHVIPQINYCATELTVSTLVLFSFLNFFVLYFSLMYMDTHASHQIWHSLVDAVCSVGGQIAIVKIVCIHYDPLIVIIYLRKEEQAYRLFVYFLFKDFRHKV